MFVKNFYVIRSIPNFLLLIFSRYLPPLMWFNIKDFPALSSPAISKIIVLKRWKVNVNKRFRLSTYDMHCLHIVNNAYFSVQRFLSSLFNILLMQLPIAARRRKFPILRHTFNYAFMVFCHSLYGGFQVSRMIHGCTYTIIRMTHAVIHTSIYRMLRSNYLTSKNHSSFSLSLLPLS